MIGDERWVRYATVPALILSLPLYAASTAYFLACRSGFEAFFEFIDACPLHPVPSETEWAQ